MKDFDYLEKGMTYFDSACQSLRPKPVIEAMEEYFTKYNSCGERVKYAWGKRVDEEVEATREAVLNLLKLKGREYFVSFTLNTTYGVNLLLSQLNLPIKRVFTSDVEHNSVFLPTIEFARRNKLERIVLERDTDGSLPLTTDFSESLVVVNAMSNIDGRTLKNVSSLVKRVKADGGFIILDAAQAIGANFELLQKVKADAILTSGHKMYSSSLGVMIVNRKLTKYITTSFIGGGQVAEVTENGYTLLGDDHAHTIFEAGLQAWGEIIALGAAIPWLKATKKKRGKELSAYTKEVFDFLSKQPNVTVINNEASPVISFYSDKLDSHLIAKALSHEGIMVRSGYFCCHYYLNTKKKLPPLVRISFGLHNEKDDITKLISTLERIFN